MVDGASFGGGSGVDNVVATLRQRRFPVSVIKKDMDLRIALEKGFSEGGPRVN
jgi:hypothetical protein